MNLIFCGLGGYFVALFFKTASPWPLKSWHKIAWVIVGAFGTAALIERQWASELVILGLGGSGLAVTIHRLNRMVLGIGDRMFILNLKERRQSQR